MRGTEHLTTLEVSFDDASEVSFEPYAYALRVKQGDKLEVTLDINKNPRVHIEISKAELTFSCYEPVINVNGSLEIDLSQP